MKLILLQMLETARLIRVHVLVRCVSQVWDNLVLAILQCPILVSAKLISSKMKKFQEMKIYQVGMNQISFDFLLIFIYIAPIFLFHLLYVCSYI